jgi:metallo-beta-lactamase family protein
MALVGKPGPWMALAGAGMCTGGRIMNHLTNHLSDPSTLVLMVGYQSRGSVGRALVDGAREVRIAGRKINVQARTHLFSGLRLRRWSIRLDSEKRPRLAERGRIRIAQGLVPRRPLTLEALLRSADGAGQRTRK